MPLRILHVLSSNFIAGSVVYALELARKQTDDGHTVFVATDNDSLPGNFSFIKLPVSKRSLMQRYKNVCELKKIIKEHDISVVHAHSRAASWISYYAVRNSHVPLVSTIHGRQVKHSSKLKRADVYGEKLIGICPNLVEHLVNEMQFDKKKITLIPNGINPGHIKEYPRSRGNDGDTIISIIGRFNGPKGQMVAKVLSQVFPDLLEKYPSLYLKMVGGEWNDFPAEGKKAYDELKEKYRDRIHYYGFSSHVPQFIADSDLLIGAGRVALEGLFNNVPVLAVGEVCCHGILSSSNINEAVASNFGDILPTAIPVPLDIERFKNELLSFMDKRDDWDKPDFSKIKQLFDVQRIHEQVIAVYKSAIIEKKHPGSIPILMYHKVPVNPIESQHRIFVTRDNFKKHLLFYKLRGLTSLTFKDYNDFVEGNRSMKEFPKKPFILTFDDGYADNFKNMLPLTQKYGFKGVLFLLGNSSILANNWDKGEDPAVNALMTPEQKKAFIDAGWEIGAHTFSHAKLTDLTSEDAMEEIVKGKLKLEAEFNIKTISFAYPYGNYTDQDKELVKKAGFTYGIATDTGGMTIEDDRLAVFRVNMFPEEDFLQLYKKTSSWYRVYYKRKRGK
ncbi:MAG: polysaccharide deacetylase family protein [Bacteroidota bacterium]|nr:polysaccharide deacetylase family protein [Bacteroidota bacterium]